MTTENAETTGTAAVVAAQGANVAPEKAPAKKGASSKKAAPKGQPPGEMHQYADNTLLMGEAAGLGSADLSKIDVRGVPIKDAVYDYEAHWKGQAPV